MASGVYDEFGLWIHCIIIQLLRGSTEYNTCKVSNLVTGQGLLYIAQKAGEGSPGEGHRALLSFPFLVSSTVLGTIGVQRMPVELKYGLDHDHHVQGHYKTNILCNQGFILQTSSSSTQSQGDQWVHLQLSKLEAEKNLGQIVLISALSLSGKKTRWGGEYQAVIRL